MNNNQSFTVNMQDRIRQTTKEALCLSSTGISYYVSQELAKIYPHKALVKGKDPTFKVEAFARAGHCTMLPSVQIHNQRDTAWNWSSNEPYQIMRNGSLQIQWRENQIDVVLISFGREQYYWILADTQEVADDFFSAVCKWNSEIKSDNEILEFLGGCWSKNPKLLQDIKKTTLDDPILEETLKQKIKDKFNKDKVLASLENYREHGVPWKRGYLFYGPPGNGKTLTIKAIINHLQLPCLYVRILGFPENIYRVFERARQSAPCLLILEDLDSLINKQNRSLFLNEVDGLSSNHGIMMLATTNYPERLDSAIMQRPRRFDDKLLFNLPGLTERVAYIQRWNEGKLKPPIKKSTMRLSDTKIPQIAELTDGFSFAYLQELFFSSMDLWMETQTPGEMDRIMISQVSELKEQISLSDEGETNKKEKVNQFLSLFKMLSQEE